MNENYYMLEYDYEMKNYGKQIGYLLRKRDAVENGRQFFLEVGHMIHKALIGKSENRVKEIVWWGVHYHYMNPGDILKGVFKFMGDNGIEWRVET